MSSHSKHLQRTPTSPKLLNYRRVFEASEFLKGRVFALQTEPYTAHVPYSPPMVVTFFTFLFLQKQLSTSVRKGITNWLLAIPNSAQKLAITDETPMSLVLLTILLVTLCC